MKVMVYGSLRKGCGNHGLLSKSEYLGESKVAGFDMYSLGAFPMCLKGKGTIVVEIYDVSKETFRDLDCLEGYPSFYDRLEVKAANGITGWMYYGHDESYKKSQVVTGDWKREAFKVNA